MIPTGEKPVPDGERRLKPGLMELGDSFHKSPAARKPMEAIKEKSQIGLIDGGDSVGRVHTPPPAIFLFRSWSKATARTMRAPITICWM